MSYYGYGYNRWKPYVPVAKRKANAASYAAKLAKQEKRTLAPVTIEGRQIATSFWGRAWCDHLEQYSDFENRLPRGRTYARNGSVIDLQIERGCVKAIVSGSDVYRVTIKIKTLQSVAWKCIRTDCSASIHSLIDLLQGRFDQGVMQRLVERDRGMFPQSKEIEMKCSCPDWAGMCKHIAAVLYGVGARLDTAPELLFTLRNVDHLELITQAAAAANLDQALTGDAASGLGNTDLGEMFGIELEMAAPKGKSSNGKASNGMSPRREPSRSPRKAKVVVMPATNTANATKAKPSRPRKQPARQPSPQTVVATANESRRKQPARRPAK